LGAEVFPIENNQPLRLGSVPIYKLFNPQKISMQSSASGKGMSRGLARIHHELSSPENAPTNRRLYFRSAHILKNRMGNKFRLRVIKVHDSYHKAVVIWEPPSPKIGAHMVFLTFKKKNYVSILHLNSFSTRITVDVNNFSKPDEKLRGYGFLPIAIEISSLLAKKHGVANIHIVPVTMELGKYYLSYGFVPQNRNFLGEMLLPIKTINP
jgi:hypothetical protein